MKKLEVFFDYACPYCWKGHKDLMGLLKDHSQIEVIWRPCESHPRPERYGPHSDLCIQGMFFAMDQGVDVLAYHNRMYKAALVERIDIENVHTLTNYIKDLLDADAFRNALIHGDYVKALDDANHYAFNQSEVWVVPAYRMNGKKLDSVEDIGVTKKQLDEFLRY